MATKKATAKKTPAKKVVAKKAPAKKAVVKKVVAKKTPATKKAVAKKIASKKAIAPSSARHERKPAPIRYVNRATGESWNGVGPRSVAWLKTAMDNGVNPDQFLVKGMEHRPDVLRYWDEHEAKHRLAKAYARKRPLYQSPIDPSLHWDGDTRVTPDFIKEAIERGTIDAWLAPSKEHHVNVQHHIQQRRQRLALLEWGYALYEEPENFKRLKEAFDGLQSMGFELGVMTDVPFFVIEQTSSKAEGRKLIDERISAIHYLCQYYEGNPYTILAKLMEWCEDKPFWTAEHKYSLAAVCQIFKCGSAHTDGLDEVLNRIVRDERWAQNFYGWWDVRGDDDRQLSLDCALEKAMETSGSTKPLSERVPTVKFLLTAGADPMGGLKFAQDYPRYIFEHEEGFALVHMARTHGLVQLLDVPKCRLELDVIRQSLKAHGSKSTPQDWRWRTFARYNLIGHAPGLFELTDEEYVCAVMSEYSFHLIEDDGHVEEMRGRIDQHKDEVRSWATPGGLSLLSLALKGDAPPDVVKQLLDLGVSPFNQCVSGADSDDQDEKDRPLLLNDFFGWGMNDANAQLIIEAMVAQMETKDFEPYEPLAEKFQEQFEKAWLKKTLPQATKKGGKKPIRL